jgi:hypothetical protein
MSETSESKTSAPLYYELDSRGVEILPFSEDLRTVYDHGNAKRVNLDGKSWRVHKLPLNFRANINTYLKFMDGAEPENLFEQMTLVRFNETKIDETLRQMSEDVPSLFEDFVDEYHLWRRLKQISSNPVTTDDMEFKRLANQLDADHDRQARRIIYESSAYVYLGARTQSGNPHLLYT